MNPYEAIFKALFIVWGTAGLIIVLDWIVSKLKNGKRK